MVNNNKPRAADKPPILKNKRKEVNEMIEVTGLNEFSQMIEYNELLRKHERKSKKALINQKISEYIAEGIEKTIAEVMAKVFYEHEFEM